MMQATTLGITGFPFHFACLERRHNNKVLQESPPLKTIKEWIAADFKTRDKEIKKRMMNQKGGRNKEGRGE